MATYYVNTSTGNDSAAGAISTPWKTISKAVNSAYAGDTVIFLGDYTTTGQSFNFVRSGTSGSKITFKCDTGHTTTVDSRSSLVLQFNGYDHIILEGFYFIATRLAQMSGTVGCELINCTFRHYQKNSTYASNPIVMLQDASYCRFDGCDIEGTYLVYQDMIQFDGAAHHNIVENCILKDTAHFLIILDGKNQGYNPTTKVPTPSTIELPYSSSPNHNIIRNNYLRNEYHSGIANEIGANWNVVEGNYIERCGSGIRNMTPDPAPFDVETGIAIYSLQPHGIVRNNIVRKSGNFTANSEPALWVRADQSGYNGGNSNAIHNRVYNNIFYDNYACVIHTGVDYRYDTTPLPEFGDNKFYNNLIIKNGESASFTDTNVAVAYEVGYEVVGGPQPDPNALNDEWKNNVIEESGETQVLKRNNTKYNLGATISDLPSVVWSNNIQPTFSSVFANPNNLGNEVWGDLEGNRALFALSPTSPCINAGTHLTTANGAGSNSSSLKVYDSYWFVGGSNPANWDGIAPGDIIQVGLEVVQITSIDYNTHTLTLNRNISWANGAKVSFPYTSSAPDIGLLTASTPAPTNVKYVNQDGSGDYTTIAQVNAASIASGWTVSFKSGQTFTGQLVCKTGVTYNTHGGTAKAQIGTSTDVSIDYNINITSKSNVTINNLKIYTAAKGGILISSSDSITISNCEILGGANKHINNSSEAIYCGGCSNITISDNIIHDIQYGIPLYNTTPALITRNIIYDIWQSNATYTSNGGAGIQLIGLDNYGDAAIFDCNYGVILSHNEFYNYDRWAMISVTYSKCIVEYNIAHDNLNEAIFGAGQAHGGLIKAGDRVYPNDAAHSSTGNIIRYNTCYNLIRHQESSFYDGINREQGNVISYGGAVDMWIYGNLIYNCDLRAIGEGNDAFTRPDTYSSSFSVKIFNNTFYNVGNWLGAQTGSWSGRNAIRLSNVRAIVQNNIIHIGNSEDYGNAIYSNTGSIVSIGNNIFVNRSGINTHPHADVLSTKDAFFVEDGSSYISLASNLFNTNPLFETGKYTLTSQSLAINAGVTLGNAGDGTAIRPLGYVSGAVDIGYAEYGYGGAVITYDEPPYITANPENQSGFAGGSATFTVSAESTDTLGYQWWKEPYVSELESKIVNSTKYSGATTNTLIINNLSTSDSTSTNGVSYVCEVYNTNDPSNLWQNSNSATLSVLENTGRVTSGVMSLYDFGETSGQTVSDSISPAINLTITGTVKQ